ncbi:MAG: NAD(P)/FAD-dependent oxidoreductase [Microbacteriaceae bacterium]
MATWDAIAAENDLVVIGGGAGGLAAARAAARRGARTLLVEQGRLGGDCTFTGCVPSKTLIASAARGRSFVGAMADVRRAVETIAESEDDAVLEREGVRVVHGRARFRDPHLLDVDGRRLRARRVIIATGAGPSIPPIPGLDTVDYLTNETVFDLDRQPRSLAVLGGGPIGCELAQAFARLGTAVTVIEALPRILVREEPETSAVITEALRGDGVDVRVGRRVVRAAVTRPDGGVTLHLDDGRCIAADRLLVAVGRAATTTGLELDDAGIETRDGFILTDDRLRTTAPGVWAVGDVTGHVQLTHAADEMGRIAAANALGRRARRFDATAIPSAVFTSPEVGRVGVTEAEVADRGARVAYLPLTEVDRAIATGETRGFVKLIAGPRRVTGNAGGGRLLGASTVAPTGGELVHEVALAMRARMFTGRLAQTVHAYPTWSVAVRQAAAQFFGDAGGGRRARTATRPD